MSGEKKLRAAAYCRVSRDGEDQKHSFESQKRYFLETVGRDPRYLLTEIFADEGISGTSVKKRREFLRMMAAARAGEIDLIFTKEISRFARNTLDSIRYTRELRALGVGVIFLADGIDTREGDAELRLAILSSLAQEESRRTSERVKWGQTRRMEAGVVFGHSLLGYDVKNGVMTVNESGARIVREIFRRFTEEGKGTHIIARELREEGIFSSCVIPFTATGVLRILKNEKYCGDLVQKKTYTPDFLTHEKKYNRGAETLVILRDHHEPIVTRAVFDHAQALLAARAEGQKGIEKYAEKHAFSGRIVCGICGGRMTARKNAKGEVIYRCRNTACAMTFGLREQTAFLLARRAFIALDLPRETMKSELLQTLFSMKRTSREAEAANQRLIELYLTGEITREEFRTARSKYAPSALNDADEADARTKMEEAISRLLAGEGDGFFFRLLGVHISVFEAGDVRLFFEHLPYVFFFRVMGRGDGQKGELLRFLRVDEK